MKKPDKEKPGKVGARPGSQNAALPNKRMYSHAIIRHGVQHPEKVAKMVKMQYDLACEGDTNAFKFIVERIEGKPAQALTIGGEDDGPPIQMEITIEPSAAYAFMLNNKKK
jgi:hypothetical protein